MADDQTVGGFTGDPLAALTVAGSAGCCGNPARDTNITLPEPTGTVGSCCGTPAAAGSTASSRGTPTQGGTCCGTPASADPDTAAQGCCS
ncbi:hypothetical protein AB0J86_37455 [Micromonospora sp. NPDC049559]|uniref:hypothetical protein n=1 Tax=Micromonospora sp. NPDC049559 TaxID=3155923 RepID=UPI0034276C16